MAPLFLFLLFLSAFCSNATAQERAIGPNSSLTPTGNPSSWLSPSGLYAFGFYKIGSGYAVGVFMPGIPEKTVVWTANRDNAIVPANVTLLITADGRLALQLPRGQDMTNIVSLGEKVSSASMLDSGNFVLYNSANKIIWQSFENPTDTLLPGMRLAADQQLFSSVSPDDPSTGPFRLVMQEDGNLVQYPTVELSLAPYAYYSSYTDSNGLFVTLNLDNNGYMYLLKENKTIIFNLTRGYPEEGLIYRAAVDVDGIFRLYSISPSFKGTWTMRYQTTADKCDPKGICGFNAYCTVEDTESVCKCLPGFDFSADSNRVCERNFSTPGCKNPSRILDMRFLENTLFQDDSYSTTKASTKEECAQACQQDCSCEAAMFTEDECGKQRLPLRYGRRKMDDTTVAMVKMPSADMPSTEGIWNMPSTEESARSKPKKKAIIASSVSVAGCLFLAVLLYILWTFRIKKRGGEYITKIVLGNISEKSKLEELPLYDYETIAKTTENFDVKNKLGQGGFGPVYKGKLLTGQDIAVKRLSNSSSQGMKEFMNEVTLISKLQHRNLVRLLGCCVERDEKMLVYEYLPNKSLDTYIFDSGKQDLLDWNRRCLIIEGIGRGLLYLHRDSRLRIIHRDLKASNILLDIHLNPKISDFGLARIFGGEQDQANTNRVVGTYGYMAPEYAMEGKFSEKSDVYSFGVLLLEIVSGKRNTNFYQNEENISLLGYAWKLWNESEAVNLAFTEQHDPIVETEVRRFAQVGLLCVQDNPNDRPNMSNVLSMLNSEMTDLPLPKLPVYTSTILVSEDHCYPQSRPSNNGISLTELQAR